MYRCTLNVYSDTVISLEMAKYWLVNKPGRYIGH